MRVAVLPATMQIFKTVIAMDLNLLEERILSVHKNKHPSSTTRTEYRWRRSPLQNFKTQHCSYILITHLHETCQLTPSLARC